MAGRDAVDDAVPLTPIQHWFMETPMRDRNRWCLSAVFALPFLPPLERLRAVAHALQQRPDALRMRWVAGLNGMAQQSGQTQEPIVRIVQGASSDADIQERTDNELAAALMASLDLNQGRVFALGAIAMPDGQARLVAVVHHVVFAMVSWSILADDLEAELLDGGAPAKPARSEEHTSELQSLMRISYAVFCLKKKKTNKYT